MSMRRHLMYAYAREGIVHKDDVDEWQAAVDECVRILDRFKLNENQRADVQKSLDWKREMLAKAKEA